LATADTPQVISVYLQDTTRFLIDEAGNALYTTTAGKTACRIPLDKRLDETRTMLTYGWLRYALDVVT